MCVYIVSGFTCVFPDVYVFGIGEEVKRDQLNALASKKCGEKHVFILKKTLTYRGRCSTTSFVSRTFLLTVSLDVVTNILVAEG